MRKTFYNVAGIKSYFLRKKSEYFVPRKSSKSFKTKGKKGEFPKKKQDKKNLK